MIDFLRRSREPEARAAMRDLARALSSVANRSSDLFVEARQARLLAVMPLRTHEDLSRALKLAGEVQAFVDNWSDCAKPRSTKESVRREQLEGAIAVSERDDLPTADADVLRILISLKMLQGAALEAEEAEAEDFYKTCLMPVRQAVDRALMALCELVDEVVLL